MSVVATSARSAFHHHTGVLALLQAQVCEAPRPPSLLSTQPIPEALDRVVLRALSKRPEDRFASAAEFDAALASATAPDPPRRWAETEPLDVSAFRALRGAPQRQPALPPTEPLDVSMFKGTRRAPERDHEPMTTPRVEIMQRFEMPPPPATLPSVPRPAVAGPSPHATRVLVAVIVATLVATGALLALACGLWLAR